MGALTMYGLRREFTADNKYIYIIMRSDDDADGWPVYEDYCTLKTEMDSVELLNDLKGIHGD